MIRVSRSSTAYQAQVADQNQQQEALPPVLVSFLYVLAHVGLDQLSLTLAEPQGTISIYLPAGLSLALLIAGGLRYLPVTLLASLGTATVFRPSWSAALWPAVLGTVVVRTAGQAWVVALLPQDVTLPRLLRTLPDVVWFILTVLSVPLFVIALAGLAALHVFSWAPYLSDLFAAWVADVVGIMTVTPFLLTCVFPWAQHLTHRLREGEIAEREQTEQALRESEGRFRHMANTAPVMIWMSGPDGGCTYFNQPWLDFRGRRLEEELGDGWVEGVHPEDLAHCLSTYHAALDTQEPFSMEYRLRHADGTYRWIFDKGMPRFHKDGRLVEFIGACTDVTDLKEAERALQRSEARYRAVVEDQTELICRFLPDTTLTFVNEAYCRYFDQPREALMGQRFLSLIAEEDQAFACKQIAALSPQRPINTYEHRVHLANGELRWQRWTDRAILDEQGHIIEIQSVGRDVTQRKRVEQALQKVERDKAIILNATAEMFIYYDTDLRIQWANRAAGISVGQHPEALVGRPCYEIWHQSTKPCESCPIMQALATGEPQENEMTMPDGRIWHLRGYPVFEEGEIVSLVEFGQDITERKRAEAQSAREVQRSAALLRVAARLSGHLARDELLGTLCEESARALSTASAAVLSYDEKKATFFMEAQSGLPDTYETEYRPPSRMIHERVMQNGGTFIVPDASLDSDLPNYALYRRHDVRTVAGTRIAYKGKLLGVLTVNTVGAPRTFTEDDLALLGGIADQAAQALVNAQLFDQVRAGQRHLARLSKRLVEAQETERRHLARELHDEIGQALTVLKISLQAIESAPDAPTTRQHLENSLEIVEQTLQQVRDLSLNLRPSLLDDLGLVPALRWFMDRQGQQAEFTVHFAADEIQEPLPPDLDIAYFRIAQEALTNIMRHAQAQHVHAELHKRASILQMTIRDDGVGFDVEEVLESADAVMTSMGLLNMQERALLIDSQIDISSIPGKGTEIRVSTDLSALADTSEQPSAMEGA